MAKEIKNAEFVSARRSLKVFGRDCTQHYVLSIGVKNPDTDVTHYADLPLVLKPGAEWGFYDKETNASVVRNTTTADTNAAIQHARKVFPAWADYVDSLQEGSSYADAFRWFDDNAGKGVMVATSFDERTYSVNGETKVAHGATLYEQFNAAMPDDFDALFGKSLKAAGVKLGKAAAKAAASVPSKPVAKNAAAIPPEPPATTAPDDGRVYTFNDAWAAYNDGGYMANDPQGLKFYDRCAEIVGKAKNTYKTWTSKDWKKITGEFLPMPF